MGSLRFSHGGIGYIFLAPFDFYYVKWGGGGKAPPGPERAEKTRFFCETTGRMV